MTKKEINLNIYFFISVPNVYPVDLFEHIWAVDRLERLGISRYFESEIKDCLDYVYRYSQLSPRNSLKCSKVQCIFSIE